MPRARARPATSLLELSLALAILAVLFGLALPPILRGLDAEAVRVAADTLLASLGRARAAAVAAGGATLVVDLADARWWVETAAGETAGTVVEAGEELRVLVAVDGAADTLRLRFDALGIGRMTSRTVRLRRGHAEAVVSISSYGRARKW